MNKIEEERQRVLALQRQRAEEEEQQRRKEQRQRLEEIERKAQEETVRRREQQAEDEVKAMQTRARKEAAERKEMAGVNAVAVQAALLQLMSAASESMSSQRELAGAVRTYTDKLYEVVKARAAHDDAVVGGIEHDAERCRQEIVAAEGQTRRSADRLQKTKKAFDAATATARTLGMSRLADEAGQTAGEALREVDDDVAKTSQAVADQAVMEGFCQQMAERHQQYQQDLERLAGDAERGEGN